MHVLLDSLAHGLPEQLTVEAMSHSSSSISTTWCVFWGTIHIEPSWYHEQSLVLASPGCETPSTCRWHPFAWTVLGLWGHCWGLVDADVMQTRQTCRQHKKTRFDQYVWDTKRTSSNIFAFGIASQNNRSFHWLWLRNWESTSLRPQGFHQLLEVVGHHHLYVSRAWLNNTITCMGKT